MSTFTLEQFKKLTAAEQAVVLQELQAKRNVNITFKVSEKGCLSVYGIGRFPVTLYASQWERILDKAEDMRAFIKTSGDKLTRKAS